MGRPQLARAAIEAMAYQTRDVVDTMAAATGQHLTELRVDGGASVMDLLLQFQSDLLDVPVVRAAVKETTALGAAFLAGLAEGVWTSLDEIAAIWSSDARGGAAQRQPAGAGRPRGLETSRRAIESLGRDKRRAG